jgi:hypothetical protein
VHRHATPAEAKDAAEAYTSLANAHYLAEQAAHQAGQKDADDHLGAAERYYRKALSFDLTFDNAKKNLDIVYHEAQAEGRLRKAAPPAKMPGPGEPPFTGYEVAPSKG